MPSIKKVVAPETANLLEVSKSLGINLNAARHLILQNHLDPDWFPGSPVKMLRSELDRLVAIASCPA
jgi:hypothetical protein